MEQKTNDKVQGKINFLVGLQEPLLATVEKRELAWFGHVTRHVSLSISKTVLQDTLEGGRHRGRWRKCWVDNVKRVDVSSHTRTAHEGFLCKKKLNRPSRPHGNRIGQGTELIGPSSGKQTHFPCKILFPIGEIRLTVHKTHHYTHKNGSVVLSGQLSFVWKRSVGSAQLTPGTGIRLSVPLGGARDKKERGGAIKQE